MTASPIWVKSNYQEGEFIDISKALALRIVKNGVWYHVNAEFILRDITPERTIWSYHDFTTMERTIWSFYDLAEAKDYLAELLTKKTAYIEDL